MRWQASLNVSHSECVRKFWNTTYPSSLNLSSCSDDSTPSVSIVVANSIRDSISNNNVLRMALIDCEHVLLLGWRLLIGISATLSK